MSEKLQKVLARVGFGSRREIETWIEAGRVKVNRAVAKLGDRVIETDQISIDGRAIANRVLFAGTPRALIYNKDAGTVCTRSDPEGRPTIFDHLPKCPGGRWIAVGRLDISTTGLLLITTDGELANRLMHPSQEVEREYLVRVLGKVENATIESLRSGVMLEDGMAKFDSIDEQGGTGANHWYRVTLKEGRNREVRRLWESQGIQVSRLVRIRYGNLTIPKNLRRGSSVELDRTALNALYTSVAMPTPFEKKTAAKKAALNQAAADQSKVKKSRSKQTAKPKRRPAARQGRRRTP